MKPALGDTWSWDGVTWRQLRPATSPPAMWGHTLTFDLQRDRFVLFGGFDGTKVLDGTWEFDGVDWIKRQPTARPGARRGSTHRYVAVTEEVLDSKTVPFTEAPFCEEIAPST